MAEDTDPDSKTEDATGKRMGEARAKGDVPKSHDVPQWMSLAAVTGVLVVAGGTMANNMMRGLLPFIAHPADFELENNGGVPVMRMALEVGMPMILTVLLTGTFAGMFGSLIQTGFLWAPDKIMPDFSKLSPFGGLKRLFGVDGFVQFLKSVIKIFVIGVICWATLKPHWSELQSLSMADPERMLPFMIGILKSLFVSVLAAMGVAALADWVWQRLRFAKRMKMSREEIKEEHRQAEGDPMVRAKQKQLRLEKAKRRMMANVAKATVVVVNPTHYAVALLYDTNEAPAPLCVAKGMDSLALKIREIAEANNVPIIEDPPLARALYATVELDQSIPRDHYEAVAKVIGFVLSANRRRARAHR
jgi:flagellar biosynthetic protein FlhB